MLVVKQEIQRAIRKVRVLCNVFNLLLNEVLYALIRCTQ
jgi:hypothetical protein